MSLTPQQIKVIETWTEKRDSLLREIGVHTTELEEKKKLSNEASLTYSDLEKRISEARGRLAELDALEERHKNSVSIEVSELEARKSRLEGECKAKEDELVIFDKRGDEKLGLIKTLSVTYDHMSDQAAIVDQVVGKVIAASHGAMSEVVELMTQIRTVATEVIDKSNANVAQANIVIEKMPKVIFDMQRPIPVRRTYPLGHPKHEHVAP